MLTVSDSIKNAYNKYTTQRKSYIKVGDNSFFIQNLDIQGDTYENGNVIGNAIAKIAKFDIETENVKELNEFELFDGIWTGSQYEYISLGTFKLFNEEGTDAFFSSITAYDKLILFNKEYNPYETVYPTTVFGLLKSICLQAGVELANKSIPNGSQILEENLFVESETLKQILNAICQISGNYAIISNDKLKLQLYNKEKLLATMNPRISNAKETNMDMVIYGKSEQETRSGKNLWNLSSSFSNTTTTEKWVLTDTTISIPAGTYTFSSVITGDTTTAVLNYKYADNADHLTTINEITTLTFTEEVRRVAIKLYPNSSMSNIQLEEGSIATEYEEYGVGPSPVYPSEIETVKGIRNLFDKDNANVLQAYFTGTSETIDTGTVTGKMIYIECKPNTTYTISKMLTARFVIGSTIEKPDNNVVLTTKSQDNNATNLTITTGPDDNYLSCWLYHSTYDTTITFDEILSSVQIEEGAIAHDFVPYGSWLKVKSIGKNLLNNIDFEVGNISYTGENITSTTTYRFNAYNPIKSETKIYFLKSLCIYYYDKDKNYISADTSGGLVKTTPSNTAYIRFRTFATDFDTFNNENYMVSYEPIIEYEPYKENSTLIDMNIYDEEGNITDYYELASIGDTKDELSIIDNQTTLTKKIKKVVFDGSEDWRIDDIYNNITQFSCDINDILINEDQNTIDVMSNYFKGDKWYLSWTRDNSIVRYVNASAIRINSSRFTTVDELKTWLSENPVTVYYELAEYEEIDLGEVSLKTLEGENNITLTSNINTEIELNFSGYFELQKYQISQPEYKRTTWEINQIVLGMSDVNGEYVKFPDDIDIDGDIHKLVINDNPFVYTQELRELYIENIYNQVKGFGYIAFETIWESMPFIELGDLLNIDGKNSIVLRYNLKSPNGLNSLLSAPSIIDSAVGYVDNSSAIQNRLRRTEIFVNKHDGEIDLITQNVQEVEDELGNVYTKIEVNELIQTSETGLTNTFTQTGGNNLFKNSAPYFMENETTAEFWEGSVKQGREVDSINGFSLLLQTGIINQSVNLKNDTYSVSFKWKRLISLSNAIIRYNGREITLPTDTDYGYIETTDDINTGLINFEIECDTNGGIEIYELMLNIGSVPLIWSQNANESTNDIVNISKGITVNSSTTNTLSKMDSDGFRVLNETTKEETMKATDTGGWFKDLTTTGNNNLSGLIIQKVGDEIWISGEE